MSTTISVLIGLALFWVLAYRGSRLPVFTGAFAAYFVVLNLAGVMSAGALTITLLLYVPVMALFNLTRPAMDYQFFQILSDRIDQAEGENLDQLKELREQLLEITQQIDEAQQAQALQAANLLRSLLEAEDLDQAIQSALPMIDELFLGTLQANLTAAREQENQEAVERLEEIERRLNAIIEESLPPSLRLAQRLLDAEDLDAAKHELEQSPELIDDQLLSTLMGAAGRLEEAGQQDRAELVKKIHRHAAGLSMRSKMKKDK